MIKWDKKLVYNIQMDQWERMWLQGLTVTLQYNL